MYEASAGSFGLEYSGLVTVGAADPSFTAPCLALLNNGAEVINVAISPTVILPVVEECDSQGYTGAYMASGNSLVMKDLETLEGVTMMGLLTGFPWWADAEPAQQFRDVMADAGFADYETASATTAWAALELFRKAMTEFGPAADAEVTAADVIAAYHQIDGETLDGLLAQPITYTTEGPQPVIGCFWPMLYQNGEPGVLPTEAPSGNGVEGDLKSLCTETG